MKFLTSNTAILVGSRNSGYRLFFRVHLYGMFCANFCGAKGYPNVQDLKKFNKTTIPFALVGNKISYSQVGAMRRVCLPSYIRSALLE